MSNNVAFILGVIAGVTVGVIYEHQRFVREIQGLSKQHAAPAAPAPAESA
jgi:hypothetical protein